MNKSLVSSIAAATLVGSIGLVFAQSQSTDATAPAATVGGTPATTTDTTANPGMSSTATTPGTASPTGSTQDSSPATATTPSTTTSVDNPSSTSSGTMRDDMTLAARADRN